MAGRIPQSFIDDLLNRIDIVDVIDARVPLKKQGSNWVACCPFHDEKTPSFSVSPGKQFYYCFGCGASGTAVGFLMDYEHMEFVEAIETLASSLGVDVPREGANTAAAGAHDAIFAVLAEADRYYQAQLRASEPAKEYLRERGLSGATAARFGLGWAPPHWQGLLEHCGKDRQDALLRAGMLNRDEQDGRLYGRFRGRVMFPIRDRRGRTIAFGGRVIGDGRPKYLNSPETAVFHKGRELYGLYEARQARRTLSRLLVVEGYMDVIMLAEHGIDYAVATLGTAAGDAHAERLFATTSEVVFCFDGDNAGRQAAWRALNSTLPRMTDGREARFLFLPEGSDPDDLVRAEGREAFEDRIRQAKPLADFLIDHVRADVDATTVAGRAQLAAQARPLIARLPAGIYRELLTERLASEVGLATDRLRADLARQEDTGDAAAAPRARAARAPSAVRMTPMRTAIALLLQYPALAARVADDHPALARDEPGAALLRSLCNQIENDPQTTTARLLEGWRDASEFPYLQRLAAHEFALDENLPAEKALASEIDGALERLAEQARRERYAALLAASRERALTSDEKRELQSLLVPARSGL